MKRPVTELDFRLPEFRDAKPEDYEFRDDGKLVRKDRWENAVRSICSIVGQSVREFEIPEIVDAVRKLAEDDQGWNQIGVDGEPERIGEYDIRLIDGTLLRNVEYQGMNSVDANVGRKPTPIFLWEHNTYDVVLDSGFVVAWRERE